MCFLKIKSLLGNTVKVLIKITTNIVDCRNHSIAIVSIVLSRTKSPKFPSVILKHVLEKKFWISDELTKFSVHGARTFP